MGLLIALAFLFAMLAAGYAVFKAISGGSSGGDGAGHLHPRARSDMAAVIPSCGSRSLDSSLACGGLWDGPAGTGIQTTSPPGRYTVVYETYNKEQGSPNGRIFTTSADIITQGQRFIVNAVLGTSISGTDSVDLFGTLVFTGNYRAFALTLCGVVRSKGTYISAQLLGGMTNTQVALECGDARVSTASGKQLTASLNSISISSLSRSDSDMNAEVDLSIDMVPGGTPLILNIPFRKIGTGTPAPSGSR